MATEAPVSYIDTLLKRVASRGGNLGVRFESGAPVRITDGNGAARDVTNRSLSAQEILAAITPMIPETIKRLPQQPMAAFNYECEGVGLFNVQMRREGQQLWVSIDPGMPPFAAAPPPVAAAPPPPPPPPPAPAPKVEPELIIETTSVSAVVGANRGYAASEPAPAYAAQEPVVEVVTPEEAAPAAAPPAPVAPVAPAAAPAPKASAARVQLGTPAIDRLFHLMCQAKASDLHLCVGMPPLIRKDGEIKLLEDNGAAFDPESMWAMLEPIIPERNREEFDRRHDSDFAYEIAGLGRFRSNIFMDRKGPGAVFRVIPSKILTAEDLGLSPHILKLCQLNKGLVLVTGPTGSGKSTTLCAMVDYINRTRKDHIITIEDPIEFVHENKSCLMNQREVHVHTDGFKDALRAALREDPDIVLVGEMRDLETVAIAIETAETGHLVFGTLHTTTAASTVDRVIDQFPTDRQAQIRIMLSESLKGVIAQTLCKKIGGGRAAALEVLIVTSAVSNLIREAKTFQIPSIMQVGKSVGMVGLNDALMDLVAKKLVAPEEAYAKSVDKTGFEALLKRAGIETKFAAAAKEN
ncbi:MAG TPA: type IV pilus twitching motility protein PilT [Vicinamibacterales bacterium]|jgi:twitching motility protein PilT